MKKSGRYKTSHLQEDQYEPGSKGLVLKNLLGIKNKHEIDRVETIALKQTEDQILKTYDQDHKFTAAGLCKIHKIWLGGIYEWAGRYRQVNVFKGDFPFASGAQIPGLMAQFEKEILRRFTPCKIKSQEGVREALAKTHVELILIHPFREGNGRIARLLATLMALQAGLPLLDFKPIIGRKRREYFAAVQAGLDRNYVPMQKIFEEIIKQTLSRR